MKVVILRGIPGSGKSTLAKKEFPGAVVASSDKHFYNVWGNYKFDANRLSQTHQLCWRDFHHALEDGEPLIVVDNTNISVAEISPYVLPAQAYGYLVKIITLLCDPKEAAARNKHGVPEERVLSMDKYLREAVLPPWWLHETRGELPHALLVAAPVGSLCRA
jgi:predicted kinase